MPYFAAGQGEPYAGFARGIDRDSPRTMVAEGHYEDALNMLLLSDQSGQHITTMRKDVSLDDDVTWPTGNLYWFSPFTYSTWDENTGTLAFETHLLTLRSTGDFYRYDFGAPGTNTVVRRSPNAASQLTTHFVFDQWIVILNGRDAPLKYGQHFRFDGQQHATPYLFPLGSKPISPLVPSVEGETWILGGSSNWVADASVPDSGARVSTHSLKVSASQTARVTFTTPVAPATPHKDLLAGPRPYGGTDFGDTDFLAFQHYKASSSGAYSVRFYNTYPTKYITFTVSSPTTGAWAQNTVLLSTGSATGGFVDADFASITDIEIINSDASNDLYFDDFYMLYASAPPAGQVGTPHKDRIILGGVPVVGDNSDPALSTIFYSDSGHPDEFPSENTQLISGGAQSLSRTNRITALREYGDAVIVGTQNAIFAWTIGSDGAPSRSVITTETGIDSPRAIVETPAGSLIFPWQRGFYILRQTGRNYVSEKITPLLRNIWLEQPWWTMGIRDEKTKSIRFWFREQEIAEESFDGVLNDTPTATTTGVVFDYVRAQETGGAVWPSRMDQLADYATEAYVDGVRETLYCRFAEQGIYRMHVNKGGTLESSVTLPWLSLANAHHVSRWIGVLVPFAGTCSIRVFIRYANHPSQFEGSEFEEVATLAQDAGMADYGRVMFGRNSKWAQVKFQAQDYGFEIYPPLVLIASPTTKME